MRWLLAALVLLCQALAVEAGPPARLLPKVPCWALAFSPDGKSLAAADRERLHLFDVATGMERAAVAVGPDAGSLCLHLSFSPDGTKLASGHLDMHRVEADHFVHLWSVDQDKLRKTHTLLARKWADRDFPNYWLRHVAFSPDGKSLVAGTRDGTVLVGDAVTGRERLSFPGGPVAAYADNGRSFLSVGHDGRVRRHRAVDGRPEPPPTGGPRHFIFAEGMAFDAAAERVAVHDGNCVALLDTATGRPLRRLFYPRGVNGIAYSPDGKTVAVVETQRGVWFLDGTTGAVRGWRAGHGHVAFRPDGKTVVWGTEDGVLLEAVADILAAPGKQPEAGPVEPAGAPLRAELFARKDTYRLDLRSRAEEFSRRIILEDLPPAPKVELELRLRNVGGQPLTVDLCGFLWLALDGDGALNVSFPSQTGLRLKERPGPVRLAPGAFHAIPVTCFDHDEGRSLYWVTPGEYALHARYSTEISPAPRGAERATKEGYGKVEAWSGPLRLKVEAGR